MTVGLKAGIGVLLGAGAVGGTAVYGIYEYNKETIRDKLNGTLLTYSEEDKVKWSERAERN